MTFAEMKTEVFRRLNESSSSPVYWLEDDVEAALMDGYREMADATEWYERSYAFTLSGATYYNLETTLSDTFLSPRRARNTQTGRWLEWVNARDLDYHTYRRWELITGEPQKMLFRGLTWLGLFPRQTDGTVELYYTSMPDDLVDADTPSFPQEFHYGIVDYAIYDLMCQEAETDKALKFWDSYLRHQEGLRRYVMNRTSYERVGGFRE